VTTVSKRTREGRPKRAGTRRHSNAIAALLAEEELDDEDVDEYQEPPPKRRKKSSDNKPPPIYHTKNTNKKKPSTKQQQPPPRKQQSDPREVEIQSCIDLPSSTISKLVRFDQFCSAVLQFAHSSESNQSL
jgi:hypothetical protein